jgi:hypothetical protein
LRKGHDLLRQVEAWLISIDRDWAGVPHLETWVQGGVLGVRGDPPVSPLIEELVRARVFLECRLRALSRPGQGDAMTTTGSPAPELTCARGVVSLCSRICGREPPTRKQEVWGLCEAIWALALPANGSAASDGEQLSRWEQYLRRARRPDGPAEWAKKAVDRLFAKAGIRRW